MRLFSKIAANSVFSGALTDNTLLVQLSVIGPLERPQAVLGELLLGMLEGTIEPLDPLKLGTGTTFVLGLTNLSVSAIAHLAEDGVDVVEDGTEALAVTFDALANAFNLQRSEDDRMATGAIDGPPGVSTQMLVLRLPVAEPLLATFRRAVEST